MNNSATVHIYAIFVLLLFNTIIAALLRRKKKLILLPRGSFKSSVVTVSYPLWRLEKTPNLRILLDNEVFSNSKAFLAEAKGMLENPEVLAIYPHLEPNKKINGGWTEDSVILKARTRHRKEPILSCAGIDNTKVGMRYDIIIMEPENSLRKN